MSQFVVNGVPARDSPAQGPGRLHRRPRAGPVQAGPLPVPGRGASAMRRPRWPCGHRPFFV